MPGRFRWCGSSCLTTEFSIPKPLVLRVEISAEQAASLAPLLGAATEQAGSDRFPSVASRFRTYAADARVTELKRLESDLEQREAEFEADVQFREDRIERWRTELEELEQTLDRRERDLVSYVDQLQGAMSGSDDAPGGHAPPAATAALGEPRLVLPVVVLAEAAGALDRLPPVAVVAVPVDRRANALIPAAPRLPAE